MVICKIPKKILKKQDVNGAPERTVYSVRKTMGRKIP